MDIQVFSSARTVLSTFEYKGWLYAWVHDSALKARPIVLFLVERGELTSCWGHGKTKEQVWKKFSPSEPMPA